MKKYFILFFVALLGFVACEKEKDVLQKKDNTESPSVVTSRESHVEPTLSQGVLWFADGDAADKYYDYLEELYEAETYVEKEKDVLDKNAEKFSGFVSLRSTFADSESQEDPFEKDDVQMSILNANSEIGFGDHLYFFRLGERYKVHKDDVDAIAQVRSFPKKELLPDDVLLDYNIEVLHSNWEKTVLKSGGPTTVWPPVIVTDRTECQASAIIMKDGDECAKQSRDAKIHVSYYPKDMQPGTEYYGVLISWGDGSSQTDVPTNTGKSVFTHTYSADGAYQVRIQIFGQGSCSGDKVLDKTTTLTFNSCKIKVLSHYDTDCISSNGKWKLDLKTWNEVSNNGNKERIFARACSYKKIKGSWHKRSHWKKVHLDAIFRNGECFKVKTDSASKDGSKPCKRVKCKLNNHGSPYHQNGDAKSWARFHYSDNCEIQDEIIFCP